MLACEFVECELRIDGEVGREQLMREAGQSTATAAAQGSAFLTHPAGANGGSHCENPGGIKCHCSDLTSTACPPPGTAPSSTLQGFATESVPALAL